MKCRLHCAAAAHASCAVQTALCGGRGVANQAGTLTTRWCPWCGTCTSHLGHPQGSPAPPTPQSACQGARWGPGQAQSQAWQRVQQPAGACRRRHHRRRVADNRRRRHPLGRHGHRSRRHCHRSHRHGRRSPVCRRSNPTTQSSHFMVNHRKQAGLAAMCKGFRELQRAHHVPCVHGPCYG